VLHDDTGRPAIEWQDGTGDYYLNGIEFDKSLYLKVTGIQLLIQQIAALPDADQRPIALTYLSFERLVLDSDAEVLDVGVRGTRLYRLALPFRIRFDRVAGYGTYDYFIHMRDASHPERELIEWVAPEIGRQRNRTVPGERLRHHPGRVAVGRAGGLNRPQWNRSDYFPSPPRYVR
jgi:hypothetical protein